MDELGEKLDALLHDPQQLGRIAQLASSLVGDGGETQPPSEPQPEPASTQDSCAGCSRLCAAAAVTLPAAICSKP